MRYGSVCSGIEAATVAWHPLDWKPAFFSEIENFPRAVLKKHYPEVPLHGDFTTIGENDYGTIDLLVGGTPCQSFSIAGLREGLNDERGNLTLEFVRLAQRKKPRWILWEKVPGVLSDESNAFGALLAGLAECGYGFAYRVLDAQYFGVPQRRRRVFVVGYLGDWRPPAAVLFERESLQRNITPSREKGQRVADTLTVGANQCSGRELGIVEAPHKGYRMAAFGEYVDDETASTLKQRDYKDATDLITISLAHTKSNGSGINTSDSAYTLEATNSCNQAIAFKVRGGCEGGGKGYLGSADAAFTLSTGQDQHLFHNSAVRRLTPVECERLQGFPDIKKCATITLWFTDSQRNGALAEISNLKLRGYALSADINALKQSASSVGCRSTISLPKLEKPVVLNVRINLEQKEVQIHNQEKLLLFVSTAKKRNSFPPPIPIEDFVRLLALMPRCPERIAQYGKEALPQNIKHFSLGLNGRTFVAVSGREIKELANDAEKLTTKLNQFFMSTTLEVGSSSQSFAQTWETWSYCVLAAINSFIPEQTYNSTSYSINIEVLQGYTKISDKTADGPRYKALGNSMAVPVMRWIGQRIDLIDKLLDAQTHHP